MQQNATKQKTTFIE